jgi:hypothetical protein
VSLVAFKVAQPRPAVPGTARPASREPQRRRGTGAMPTTSQSAPRSAMSAAMSMLKKATTRR